MAGSRNSHSRMQTQPETSLTHSRDSNGFLRGSIISIAVQDFMIYTYTEFHMHPHLNMIIGPNGTGKSTIVCALAMGLANDPKVTGRGVKIWDYVRNGSEAQIAMIDITISLGAESSDNPLRIRRLIDKRNEQSTFFINKTKASTAAVERQLNRLHIQIDNICQFLPQERVSALAAMSDIDLLREVQKAAGPVNMLSMHDQLVSLDADVRRQEQDANYLRNEISTLVDKNKAIEAKYNRIQNRAQLRNKVALTRTAFRSVQFDLVREKIRLQTVERDATLARITDLEIRLAPLDQELHELHAKYTDFKSQTDESAKQLKDQQRAIEGITKEVAKLLEHVGECDRELDENQAALSAAHASIKKLKAQVAQKRSVLDNTPQDVEDQQQQAREYEQQIKDLTARINQHRLAFLSAQDATQRLANMNRSIEHEMYLAQEKMKQMETRENPRLNLLKDLQRDDGQSARVYEWIHNNRHLFKGPVRGPFLLEIDLSDRQLAHYVETALDKQRLTRTYLIQHREDYEVLVRQFVDHAAPMKVNINIYEHHEEPLPPTNIDTIKQLGFQGTLLDLVKADNYIRSYLATSLGFARIPFTCQANKNIDPAHAYSCGLSRYICNDVLFSVRAHPSKPRDTVCTTNSVGTAQYLNTATADDTRASVNAARLKVSEINARLENGRAKFSQAELEEQQVQVQLNQIEDDRKHARLNLSQIAGASSFRENMEKEIRALEASLVRDEQKPVAIQQRIDRLMKDREGHLLRRVHLFSKNQKIFTHLPKVLNAKRARAFQSAIASHCIKAALDQQKELRQGLESAKQSLDWTKSRLAELVQNGKQIKTKWIEAAADTDIEGADAVKAEVSKLRESLGLLDKSLEEQAQALEIEYQQLEAQLDASSSTDDSVVQQYEERAIQIDRRQGSLDEASAKLAQQVGERDGIRDQWLPKLETLLTIVSEKFSAYFLKIRCAGEVTLRRAELFKEYALEIRVKFRNCNDLQVLEKSRQSGGERAVTTILFLLSLQEHSKAPFRLVDEINQGMDEVNERVVHKMLVESASKLDSPQYFLITPKLLCGLHYSDQMRIHCVYNGRDVDPILAGLDVLEEEDNEHNSEKENAALVPITVASYIAQMRHAQSTMVN